ncbi:uncharacterized protein LOC100175154 [Ciona intestinalis]
MESALDVLTKAAHFVENQEQNRREHDPGPLSTSPVDHTSNHPKENADHAIRKIRKNGDSGNVTTSTSDVNARSASETSSLTRRSNDRPPAPEHRVPDDRNNGSAAPSDTMRIYNVNEGNSAEEVPSMTSYSHHSSNGVLHQSIYPDRHGSTFRRNSSTESPPTANHASFKRRSTSPAPTTDSEHPPRGMALPHPLSSLSGAATHPMAAHLPPHNPMMPFVHPLMYSGLDPAVCADVLARQGLSSLSSDGERQQSPGSSPVTTNAGLPPTGLPGLMYPLANPALLMGNRGAAMPGLGLSELPMLFPSQLAYGAATNMLPHQLASLSSLTEQDTKRLYESIPGMPQHVPAHVLAHPYLKNFCSPALDSSAAAATKDSRSKQPVPPTAAPGVPGLSAAYSADYLLRYQEVFTNEALKEGFMNAQQAASSPVPRRSSSPENSAKKSGVPGYNFPIPFYGSHLGVGANKSPIPQRKVSTPTMVPHKNGTGPSPNQEHRSVNPVSQDRDGQYPDTHDLPIGLNGNDEARRRLIALAQRPHAYRDVYSQFKGPHDRIERRSPSPYADRRRISRERSPHRAVPAPEKLPKKRSHENSFGIPPDLVPPRKNRSPSIQPGIGGPRLPKSPSNIHQQTHRRSSSPMERMAPSHHPSAAHPYLSMAGKTNEKDPSPYFTSPQYMFQPALGALSGHPFQLPTSYRPTDPITSAHSKAEAEAIAAASTLASSLYRPTAPTDVNAMAEYARLAGISPYFALLMPQQQQQHFRPPVMTHANPSAQEFAAAALKQAALQQSLLLERGEKDRISSPVASILPGINSLRQQQPQISGASKLTRGSPVPSHHKLPTKHSTPYSHHHPPPPHPYTARSRSPSNGAEDTVRQVKREVTSPPSKRSSLAYPPPHSKHPHPAGRRPDEDRANRLKRKAEEEEHDAIAEKEAMLKRKREITSDTNAPGIEEHFRRSLGDRYPKEAESTPNTVSITATVEDHFQKALGNDLWNKLSKPGNKSASPEPLDGVNGRDLRTEAAAHMPPHPYHSAYLQQFRDSRYFPTMPAYLQQPRTPPTTKTVKARAIVYPETTTTNVSPANLSRQANNSESITSVKLEATSTTSYTPVYPETSKHRGIPYPTTNDRQTSPSGRDMKPRIPPPSLHPISSPPSEKPFVRHPSSSPITGQGAPKIAPHPPPYKLSPPNTYGESPPRAPPAYSPQSVAFASSNKSPPTRRLSVDGRTPPDGAVTVPVSVQT